jgi:hypothetical protein
MGIKLEGIEEAQAWSDSIMLPVGWHQVRIDSAQETTSPQQGVPQVEIKFVGKAGDIRDWLTVTRESMGRVKSFLNAVDLPYGNNADFPTEDLSGKRLSIYVGERQREDRETGGFKTVREVKAFAHRDAHKEDPTQPDESGFGTGNGQAIQGEDIPF